MGESRKVVLGMKTTLDGRLDDPYAWMTDVPEDLYSELDRVYATFDTILVGHRTYEEMLDYWPGAETAAESSEANKSMARKMNTYKKYVLTGSKADSDLEWNNAELVPVQSDDDLAAFVEGLKSQVGGDIHLAGGASLAQTLVRLGLVDEYQFIVYPVVSGGARWFDRIEDARGMKLLSATAYSNGAVALYYEPLR